MKAKIRLLLTLCAAFAMTAQAQITITAADALSQFGDGTEFTSTSYNATTLTGLQAIADQTGGNQTFDFRTASFDAGVTSTAELVTCNETLPGCDDPDFADANIVSRAVYESADSMAVGFFQLEDDGLYFLGAAASADFDPTNPGDEEATLKFTPPQLLQKLPLTMGTTWTSNSVWTTDIFAGFEFQFDEEFVVEAWGRLITPQGEADALKIRNRTVSTLDLGGGNTIVTEDITISFVTKTGLSASLYLDAEGNVLGADYTVSTNDPNTSADPGGELPAQIALAQNHPNPFNPTTTIPFSLRQSGAVTLTIFDMLGREVVTLVNETMPAGDHTVTWQATGLPSGVYLYRLSAAGESITRSLTLLK